MGRIVIESSCHCDSPTDIEEKLEKAVSAIKLQRERREFRDVYLKACKNDADKYVKATLDSMVNEIANVLK